MPALSAICRSLPRRFRTLVAAFALGNMANAPASAQPITQHELRAHIAVLASDLFEGRAPGTRGENRTVNYIATQWAEAGLAPAADGAWYAPVQLVERRPGTHRLRFLDARGEPIEWRGRVLLRGRDTTSAMSGLPVVAVPAEATDGVAGKLVFTPYRLDDPGKPGLRDRTAALAEAGAVAVVAVVENRLWDRVTARFAEGSTTLAGAQHHAPVEGVVRASDYRKLLRKAGVRRHTRGSEGNVPIAMTADLSVDTTLRPYRSHNVVGRSVGTHPGAGTVLLMGHWDHFGICRAFDPAAPDADRICNGAVDNASGIAVLIALAKRVTAQPHARDILFLATTAEEMGLLGARAFADDPPFALSDIVAAFNLDTVALRADGMKVAILGAESGPAFDLVRATATDLGREVVAGDFARGFTRRQDGQILTDRGVPSFFVTSALAARDRVEDFLAGDYHEVGDELTDDLPLGGAMDDAALHLALVRAFARAADFPRNPTGEPGP